MLRFIFICMGVVALSFVTIGAQYMMDGVARQADDVIARNAAQEETVQAVAMEDVSPESLNAIETTAGTPTFDPNDTFSQGFTNLAPKGLEDDVQAAAPLPAAQPDKAN